MLAQDGAFQLFTKSACRKYRVHQKFCHFKLCNSATSGYAVTIQCWYSTIHMKGLKPVACSIKPNSCVIHTGVLLLHGCAAACVLCRWPGASARIPSWSKAAIVPRLVDALPALLQHVPAGHQQPLRAHCRRHPLQTHRE